MQGRVGEVATLLWRGDCWAHLESYFASFLEADLQSYFSEFGSIFGVVLEHIWSCFGAYFLDRFGAYFLGRFGACFQGM